MVRGYVYGSDSSGFREAEYREPYRGRSVDPPDSRLVGSPAVRVPGPESGGELSGREGVRRELTSGVNGIRSSGLSPANAGPTPFTPVTPLQICFGERE